MLWFIAGLILGPFGIGYSMWDGSIREPDPREERVAVIFRAIGLSLMGASVWSFIGLAILGA